MNWSQAYDLAAELLDRVRLPDPKSLVRAYPHQLSGGQKQRVAIAAAIAARPGLLIADEATSALDTIVQAEIVALIQRLVSEDGMSLLFVSHDIALASQLADRIAVFRHGEMVEIGAARQIITSPVHPYTRLLVAAHIGLDAEPLRQAAGARSMSEPLLSVSGLAKRFHRGGRIVPAVDGISFHIDRRRDTGARRPVRQRQVDRRKTHPAADRARRWQHPLRGRGFSGA